MDLPIDGRSLFFGLGAVEVGVDFELINSLSVPSFKTVILKIVKKSEKYKLNLFTSLF